MSGLNVNGVSQINSTNSAQTKEIEKKFSHEQTFSYERTEDQKMKGLQVESKTSKQNKNLSTVKIGVGEKLGAAVSVVVFPVVTALSMPVVALYDLIKEGKYGEGQASRELRNGYSDDFDKAMYILNHDTKPVYRPSDN